MNIFLRRFIFAALITLGIAGASSIVPRAAEKTAKRTFLSDGESRTYYLFVPESAAAKPAPLIITLHAANIAAISPARRRFGVKALMAAVTVMGLPSVALMTCF